MNVGERYITSFGLMVEIVAVSLDRIWYRYDDGREYDRDLTLTKGWVREP